MAPTVVTDTVLGFALTATDDEGAVGPPDTMNVTVQPIPPAVTLSGQITYERVFFGALGQGLNYPGIGFTALNAEVLIEAIDATTLNVVASGRFATTYQLTVPSQMNIALRVTGEMSRQAPAVCRRFASHPDGTTLVNRWAPVLPRRSRYWIQCSRHF